MTPFPFSIVTPEGTAYEGRPHSVTFAGVEGQFTCLARHAPMMAALRPGALAVREAGRTQYFAAGGGVLEARADGTIVALVDAAVSSPSPDQAEAKAQTFDRKKK